MYNVRDAQWECSESTMQGIMIDKSEIEISSNK